MIDLRVMALATSDTAAFAMPPNRPKRSERRSRERTSERGSMLGAIRRQLARAMSEAEDAWRPRITNYPY
jgi:hypothetical protein